MTAEESRPATEPGGGDHPLQTSARYLRGEIARVETNLYDARELVKRAAAARPYEGYLPDPLGALAAQRLFDRCCAEKDGLSSGLVQIGMVAERLGVKLDA